MIGPVTWTVAAAELVVSKEYRAVMIAVPGLEAAASADPRRRETNGEMTKIGWRGMAELPTRFVPYQGTGRRATCLR